MSAVSSGQSTAERNMLPKFSGRLICPSVCYVSSIWLGGLDGTTHFRSFSSSLFGRPFVTRFAFAIGPLSVCVSLCLSCNVGVLWPNGWMDQDATWYGGRPWPTPHCVRWGPTSPTERGAAARPHFRFLRMQASLHP